MLQSVATFKCLATPTPHEFGSLSSCVNENFVCVLICFLIIASSFCFIGLEKELFLKSGNIVSGIGIAVVNGAQRIFDVVILCISDWNISGMTVIKVNKRKVCS